MEDAVGAAEVTGAVGPACAAAASDSLGPSVDAAPVLLDLGEWDEPLSESS